MDLSDNTEEWKSTHGSRGGIYFLFTLISLLVVDLTTPEHPT